MTFDHIGEVLENLYYNGKPKVSQKLEKEDFVQLAKMASGSVIRTLYYEEKKSDQEIQFFGTQVETREFSLSDRDKKGRRKINFKSDDGCHDIENKLEGLMRLPRGLGIIGMRAVEDCWDKDIYRGQIGAEWLYVLKAYEDTACWMLRKDSAILYNIPDCVKNIEVDGIFIDDDLDIPFDIAFEIVNAVMALALRVAGFPVDKNNDGNPNVREIRNALSPAGAV